MSRILGGMGPLASADLMRQLALRNPAGCGQAHIPAEPWSDPRGPGRTAARLAEVASGLMARGAAFMNPARE